MAALTSDKIKFRQRKLPEQGGTLYKDQSTKSSNLKYVYTKQSCNIHRVKTVRTGNKMEKSTFIVEDFNTPLSIIDRKTRQKS